jgi:ADP-ribose diphosphatase
MKSSRPAIGSQDPQRSLPTIVATRTAARSRHFQVEAVQLRFGNGVEREFERIAAPGAAGTVIVVAVPAPGRILLVREYAVGLERYELGLPMGGVEPGESLLHAANRELREETGFSARNLRALTTLSLAPCILAYRAHVVLATDLVPDHAVGDEPEAPEVVTTSLGNLEHLIAQGELTEARSLAALFIAREELRQKQPERSAVSEAWARQRNPWLSVFNR